jgi:hypothetical protein
MQQRYCMLQNTLTVHKRPVGIDKLRRQKISEGPADIAQATSLWPKIAEEFNRHGIAQ